eukprot:SAG11_NODE_1114_length_5808_cov_12.177965_1_plen_100_part_00
MTSSHTRRLRSVLRGTSAAASNCRRLSGKVCVLTGGASGIGEATVRLFVEEGGAVVFGDRDVKRGAAIEAELNKDGFEVIFVQVQHDLSSIALVTTINR